MFNGFVAHGCFVSAMTNRRSGWYLSSQDAMNGRSHPERAGSVRRRQLTDDANLEITGRDVRERNFRPSAGLHSAAV
jgi:hypothetical protein